MTEKCRLCELDINDCQCLVCEWCWMPKDYLNDDLVCEDCVEAYHDHIFRTMEERR